MNSTQRIFKIDLFNSIKIEPYVLEHMYKFAQYSCWSHESGGQLFSPDPSATELLITHITGPYKSDRTSRTSWNPDIKKLKKDREDNFERGLYVVGLWHTHPEALPVPSGLDHSTCNSHLKLLDDVYTAFCLLTLGNKGKVPAISMYMAVRASNEWKEAKETY